MAKEKDTTNTSLRLPKKTLKRLKDIAHKRDITLQKLLVTMVDEFLDDHKK